MVLLTFGAGTAKADPDHFLRLEQAVIGTIQSFECADNCYLNIATSNETQLTGLCAADICEAWNQSVEMPPELVGLPVTVTLDVGSQFDDNGDLMASFIAFSEIIKGN